MLLFSFLLCNWQYEPVFTAGSQPFVHHMNVYECVGDPSVFEVLAATEGLPHIFNLGHGITPQTPIAHVERMLARLRG